MKKVTVVGEDGYTKECGLKKGDVVPYDAISGDYYHVILPAGTETWLPKHLLKKGG